MICRKGKINVDIDGFTLFLIGIFVILPLAKIILNRTERNKDQTVVTTETVSVTQEDISGKVISIKDNSGSVPLNTEIKIPVKEGTKRVTIISPEKEENKITTTGKYFPISFNKEGYWDINMYDVDGLLIDWIKITVY